MQILLSIVFGPSLLGRALPELHRQLFEGQSLAPMQGIAQIAVLLFGFQTGLHFEAKTLRGRGRSFALIAIASLATPMIAGILAGFWIAARHPVELLPNEGIGQFATAIGICMAVTALPVLAAILRETKLLEQRLGQLALGIAAVTDACLWIGLSLLLVAISPLTADSGTILRLSLVPVYLFAMWFVVRPAISKLAAAFLHEHRLSEGGIAAVCAVAIGSGAATEVLGLHYILGSFVAGAVMPEALRKPILDRLQLVTAAVLMPFFFMSTGLRTQVDLGSASFLEIFVATTALAIVGKMGGTALAARFVGESWPTALGLGALVQTKGLMEVVVLAILLDREVISTNMFSALMMMALVSTLLATPLTRWVLAREGPSGSDRPDRVRVTAGTE
jgi:Kef-type K+ transport system membrane component KefB